MEKTQMKLFIKYFSIISYVNLPGYQVTKVYNNSNFKK